MRRKFLTLNTHSLIDGKGEQQVSMLADAILCERFDVIALQEVNQKREDAKLPLECLRGYTNVSYAIPVRESNYAYALTQRLWDAGVAYTWCYLPVKIGYGRYDEGLALLCRAPIAEVRYGALSDRQAYDDWKTRMALGVRCEGSEEWFFTLHMGWWDDANDPFCEQWKRLREILPRSATVWLMGDFNQPAEVRGEGYDLLCRDGFFDAYALAEIKQGEGTAEMKIDGWRGRTEAKGAIRIDHIFCNKPPCVKSYRTLFDGERYSMISDHFGVTITVEEK